MTAPGRAREPPDPLPITVIRKVRELPGRDHALLFCPAGRRDWSAFALKMSKARIIAAPCSRRLGTGEVYRHDLKPSAFVPQHPSVSYHPRPIGTDIVDGRLYVASYAGGEGASTSAAIGFVACVAPPGWASSRVDPEGSRRPS
jgi:hypothetical protein